MFRKTEPGGRCQRCRRPARIAFWWKDGGLGWQKYEPCWNKMSWRDGNGVDVSGKIWDWVMDGEPRMVGKCDLCSEIGLLHSTTSVSAAFYGTDEIANAETNACEICVDRLRKKAPSKTYACVKGKIVRIAK